MEEAKVSSTQAFKTTDRCRFSGWPSHRSTQVEAPGAHTADVASCSIFKKTRHLFFSRLEVAKFLGHLLDAA
jgi:hypothetical protein